MKTKTCLLILATLMIMSLLVMVACDPNRYILTTSVAPSGSGTVTPVSGTYDEGTEITLTCIAASGYRFDHWSGDATGMSSTVTITMHSNKSVTANFIAQYTLTTSASPSNGGTINLANGNYDDGSQVTITASPTAGYRFDRWSGDATGMSSTVTITMDSDKIITAQFMPLYAAGLLKIGDYVQFGRYASKPILWRGIEDSANPDAKVGDVIIGDPLLFSDKIICRKPFDAVGQHDIATREVSTEGSYLWQNSNIRAWLNSSAEAGAVTWPCGHPPTKDSVDSNDYAGEKGFLAADNFTEYECNLIKPVTQKDLLYYSIHWGITDPVDGGSTFYIYGGTIDTIVSNYDSAWYRNVTDRVFLLDPKQVSGVYNRFGSYYRNNGDNYWLHAPDSVGYKDSSAANVLYIRGSDGKVLYRQVSNGSIGVRPALTLNLKSVIFKSGDGSDAKPYVISNQ